jgi:hypothetical protein
VCLFVNITGIFYVGKKSFLPMLTDIIHALLRAQSRHIEMNPLLWPAAVQAPLGLRPFGGAVDAGIDFERCLAVPRER